MSMAGASRRTKADLVKEVEQIRALNEALAAVLDKDLTFRDLEAKIRDGKMEVSAVLGEGNQPVSRFLAGLMLHWLLGEGLDPPQEPANYLSGEFRLRPAGSREEIVAYMEIVKPGGKSSHQIRMELEAENKRLRELLERSS